MLTWLHTDQLGSVVLETDANGSVVADQRYYAYGRRLDTSGSISGERDFTGQKVDATGLLYYNARYYDPQIGQFISPDTIVPDENSFLSYNRYLYANGNPLKYNDPLGHCSTLQNGERDLENDAICWSYVDIIVRHWNDDPDYWNQLFGAQDTWLEHLAPLDDFDKDWMFGQYETYLKSNSFRQAENRRNAERALLPLPGRTYAPNPCDFWDCTSAGLSAASLVTSVAQTGTAACTAVASLICGGATHALTWTDRTLGSASVAYSASQYASGDASDLDIAITSGTTLVSSIPGVGIGADLVSLVWDLADPFVPDEQLWGPRRAY